MEANLAVAASPPSSRRAALAGVAALVLGAGAAGCGGSAQPPVPPLSPLRESQDLIIFDRLLDLEYEAVAAYAAGIPLLRRGLAKQAKQILADELAHVDELRSLIKRQGGKPIKERASYDLGQPRDEQGVLTLFHTVERRQVAGYLQAIPAVAPGGARAALAAVLGNDAQHVALVRSALGEPALAGPFVTAAD